MHCGADAEALVQGQSFNVDLEHVGACRIRIVQRSKAGTHAQFERPDAALTEKIEDKLWAIQDDNTEAVTRAMEAGAALTKIFEEVDVLLTLSAPGAAPKGLGSTGDPRYNRLWTLMGTPCVNVPAYVADGGLPVGVQIIARYGEDAKALAAARFVEEALARG